MKVLLMLFLAGVLALYQFENSEERRSEIHVTDLTTCLAKSWWEKTAPEAFYPHERGQSVMNKITAGQVQYIDMSEPTTCRKCRKAYRLMEGNFTCPSCGGSNPKAHLGAMIVEFPIEPGDEFLRSMQLRAGILRDAIKTGDTPEAEPGWICDYCPFTRYFPAWA